MRTLKYWQAINEATVQCMEADPDIFVAGIGVDDFKGIFGTTRGAFERFGSDLTTRTFDAAYKTVFNKKRGRPRKEERE